MVHKYASDGTLVKSFGEAPDNVKLIKLMITGGGIDLDTRGNIVYAHAAAYRLQWFTPEGQLLRTKTRESEFYKAPAEAPNMSDPDAMRRWLSGWTPIVRVIALRNGLLIVEIRLNQHDLERYESMLDLFDDSAELIAGGIRSHLRLLCKDDHNQLFFYNPRELDSQPNKNPTILVYRFKGEKAL
ncbi:MAG: hypothetical protein HBSIN02_24770 [Bacteroidia bacterium]|nr:MAG: hypothetical protein HBSIN02_24770 [Bacteroidia bacterium]